MATPTAPVPAVSEAITLSPGVVVNGKAVTDARVKLITRGDRNAAPKEEGDAREAFLLARQIAQLGETRDQTLIAAAVEHLTAPDEARLRNAITELETSFYLAPTLDKDGKRIEAVLPVCDLVSEEFSLNPGIVVNGKLMTTCRVRLLTRGQWTAVQNEVTDIERDNATLFYALATIGGEKVQREWMMQLADVDVARINNEIERLRERYAPVPKSCPVCGSLYDSAGELENTARGREEAK